MLGLATKEELDNAIREVIKPEVRDHVLDHYVDTFPALAQSYGSRVVDATLEKILSHVSRMELDSMIVSVTGIFLMGIEIGMKIAAARATKNTVI